MFVAVSWVRIMSNVRYLNALTTREVDLKRDHGVGGLFIQGMDKLLGVSTKGHARDFAMD